LFCNNLYIRVFPGVELVGGSGDFEGNVFALNPKTGVFGPVCDDNWSMTQV